MGPADGVSRGGRIEESRDGGQSWQAGVAGLEPNTSLHDIVYDPASPKVVYASDYFSGAYRATDGSIAIYLTPFCLKQSLDL